MTERPSLYELWRQANGDRERYRELLLEHGHLIPLKLGEKPEPLPCGWPHRSSPNPSAATPPPDGTTP
jgi:hypothetical protein